MADAAPAEPTTYTRALEYVRRRSAEAVGAIPPSTVAAAVERLLRAPSIFVYGAGRSGIIGRAFAMRLVQIGRSAYVIGESVTPIVRAGDTVVILSGAGESYSSIQTANIVRREGADLLVLTAKKGSKIAHAASLLITFQFPEEAERPTLAPLGTLFESAAFQFLDGLVAEMMRVRGETEESMRRRHAIMV
jgi:6-phospho 3-hexuloisomerase